MNYKFSLSRIFIFLVDCLKLLVFSILILLFILPFELLLFVLVLLSLFVLSLLTSDRVLMYYDTNLPIKITCDASSWGLRAVLSHICDNKTIRPIMIAARTLNKAEKHYAQIDHEALALIFAIKTFHQYIYGRKFVLETDHKPLVYIFGNKKGIPVMSASRLQRWAFLLLGYNFEIVHIQGKNNQVADFLSRLPDREIEEKVKKVESEFSYFNFIDNNLITVSGELIQRKTVCNDELQKVFKFVREGWPNQVDVELTSHKNRSLELTIENNCLMWGYRLIIPKSLREVILKELHVTHSGIVRMKSMARSYVWWSGIDKDIEKIVKLSKHCMENSDNPNRSVLHVWNWL
ncbi:uncharacterized protein LOC123273311 isoform X1 [Cotesia glomerata]|uniref:uncharacterized protein LOC123273311 isoform X1 n=1 Tax=Cotesia glomerata TaxID=32391 RepID=UPI001D033334|nr:uncharacterized protein LOC123273311 isoform X1 [Cotesia glomerata]